MAEGALELRPLAGADFPLVAGWLAQPHVAAWWDSPRGLTGVEQEFGPCLEGTDPTEVFICAEGGGPVGLVQIYRLADKANYARAVGVEDGAGIDLLIGDEVRCGHGLGPHLIGRALDLVWAYYPEVTRAMAGPSVRNVRSHRAFEKAGFHALGQVSVPGEADDELVFVRPRPTGA